MLDNEIELPEKYRVHMLKGEYMGCMECHIEGDFLLIWLDVETGIIDVLRLGSHSELFKNIDFNTNFASDSVCPILEYTESSNNSPFLTVCFLSTIRYPAKTTTEKQIISLQLLHLY